MNVEGTRHLVSAAAAAGCGTIVYVSICGVYGRGPHCGGRVSQLTPAPSSFLSSSRLQAEQIVLDAGGPWSGPHVVYGHGDKGVMPALVEMRTITRDLPLDDAVRLSVIHVTELARLLARVAQKGGLADPVVHAAMADPVTVREVLTVLFELQQPALSSTAVGPAAAPQQMRAKGRSGTAVEITTANNWYEAASTWESAGLEPVATFRLTRADLDWHKTAAPC